MRVAFYAGSPVDDDARASELSPRSTLKPALPRWARPGQLLLAVGTFLEGRQDRLLRHDSVTGMQDHTQLRSGDRSEHLDGVLRILFLPL